MKLPGACHCGNLRLDFESSASPESLPLRRCTCTFCQRHGPRYASDAKGSVEIRAGDEALLGRYQFGLKLADFLFCRRCGVLVAAYEAGAPGQPGRAVINVNCLEAAEQFTAEPLSMSFDTEDESVRRTRRARTWTPATLLTTGPG